MKKFFAAFAVAALLAVGTPALASESYNPYTTTPVAFASVLDWFAGLFADGDGDANGMLDPDGLTTLSTGMTGSTGWTGSTGTSTSCGEPNGCRDGAMRLAPNGAS